MSAIADLDASLADRVQLTAGTVRRLITDGRFVPGQQLAEEQLAKEFGVSRNTLREAFRILMHESLVVRLPHRGVFVNRPTLADVLDIYRVRRVIEGQAVRGAMPRHPGIPAVVTVVNTARALGQAGDWQMVGTINMAFHAALVALSDSDRMDELFARIQAELRLAFIMIADPERMHGPFLDDNVEIARLLDQGDMATAGDLLEAYLERSERVMIAALGRVPSSSS